MKCRHAQWLIVISKKIQHITRSGLSRTALQHITREGETTTALQHITREGEPTTTPNTKRQQQTYWLNKRRVAGDPAGIPACSSFA
jgi:hypothetical protein